MGDPLGLLTSWPDEAFLTLGGRHSGTQFHAHGPAFLLLAKGKKRLLDGKFLKNYWPRLDNSTFLIFFDGEICDFAAGFFIVSMVLSRTYARKNNESSILLKSASG